MASFQSYITDDNDVETVVTVEYTYQRAYRGYRNSYGAPEEPDEEASITIDSVTCTTTGDDMFNVCSDADITRFEADAWTDRRNSDE